MCTPGANVKGIAKAKKEMEGLDGVNLDNLTTKGQRQLSMTGALTLPALNGVSLDITRQYK